MKCKECLNETDQGTLDTLGGVCWPCNDNHILDKWYKSKKELNEYGNSWNDWPPNKGYISCDPQKAWDKNKDVINKMIRPGNPNPEVSKVQIEAASLALTEQQYREWLDKQESPFEPCILTGSCTNEVDSTIHIIKKTMTLPTDSKERKDYPLFRGVLRYFSAALAGVARISKNGNDKHNPGEEMYHARGKSTDHGDCIIRHLMDVEDLLAAYNRGNTGISKQQILDEVSQMAWRALAFSQELHESLGAPLAPGARLPEKK